MKKQFTTLFLSALTMVMAFTLTSCSSDVEEPVKPTDPIENTPTVFSSESEGTRTSIDKDRWFYWEIGDKIWVKDGSNYHLSSSSSITGTQAEAKFVIDASLADETYPVLYTGYANGDTTTTLSASVTIASTQTQSAWDNAFHLGESGDCGVATAEKRGSGSYKFRLQHKAHYLILQPYLGTALYGYDLQKIVVTAAGTTLAGTYSFDENGLNTSGVHSSSSTITLNCTGGFRLFHTPVKTCFVVIQPGTHTLNIRYEFTSTEGTIPVSFEKTIDARPYQAGYATTIQHELLMTYGGNLYMWDAKKWYWDGISNFPTENDQVGTGYPTSASDERFYNTANTASYSCKDMPTAGQVQMYLGAGALFDANSKWILYGKVYQGGLWLRKKAFISGFAAGTATKADRIEFTADMKTHPTFGTTGYVDGDELGWFFLPTLGIMDRLNSQPGKLSVVGVYGDYWTSTPNPNYANVVYDIDFSNTYVRLDHASNNFKSYGFVAGTRPDGTPWFQ